MRNQGVRATATAEVLFGDSTECVKPFAIADKWLELRNDVGPAGYSDDDSFERYAQNGNNRGALLTPADYYELPNAPGGQYGPNGTGYTRNSVGLGGSDYGRRLVLEDRKLARSGLAGLVPAGRAHAGPGRWQQLSEQHREL